MDSDSDPGEVEVEESNSVQSEKLEVKSKNNRHRRKRKRNTLAKVLTLEENRSLNLDYSNKSSSQSSDQENLYFKAPSKLESEDYASKLKNFEIKNKVYPTIFSPTLRQARFFVIKAQNDDDIHKVVED